MDIIPNNKTNEHLGMHERICYVCGKLFEGKKSWIYKRDNKGKIVYFCSYTCYRMDQLEREKK